MTEHVSSKKVFSFRKWLWCIVTLNHIDPGLTPDFRCKRCGVRAWR